MAGISELVTFDLVPESISCDRNLCVHYRLSQHYDADAKDRVELVRHEDDERVSSRGAPRIPNSSLPDWPFSVLFTSRVLKAAAAAGEQCCCYRLVYVSESRRTVVATSRPFCVTRHGACRCASKSSRGSAMTETVADRTVSSDSNQLVPYEPLEEDNRQIFVNPACQMFTSDSQTHPASQPCEGCLQAQLLINVLRQRMHTGCIKRTRLEQRQPQRHAQKSSASQSNYDECSALLDVVASLKLSLRLARDREHSLTRRLANLQQRTTETGERRGSPSITQNNWMLNLTNVHGHLAYLASSPFIHQQNYLQRPKSVDKMSATVVSQNCRDSSTASQLPATWPNCWLVDADSLQFVEDKNSDDITRKSTVRDDATSKPTDVTETVDKSRTVVSLENSEGQQRFTAANEFSETDAVNYGMRREDMLAAANRGQQYVPYAVKTFLGCETTFASTTSQRGTSPVPNTSLTPIVSASVKGGNDNSKEHRMMPSVTTFDTSSPSDDSSMEQSSVLGAKNVPNSDAKQGTDVANISTDPVHTTTIKLLASKSVKNSELSEETAAVTSDVRNDGSVVATKCAATHVTMTGPAATKPSTKSNIILRQAAKTAVDAGSSDPNLAAVNKDKSISCVKNAQVSSSSVQQHGGKTNKTATCPALARDSQEHVEMPTNSTEHSSDSDRAGQKAGSGTTCNVVARCVPAVTNIDMNIGMATTQSEGDVANSSHDTSSNSAAANTIPVPLPSTSTSTSSRLTARIGTMSAVVRNTIRKLQTGQTVIDSGTSNIGRISFSTSGSSRSTSSNAAPRTGSDMAQTAAQVVGKTTTSVHTNATQSVHTSAVKEEKLANTRSPSATAKPQVVPLGSRPLAVRVVRVAKQISQVPANKVPTTQNVPSEKPVLKSTKTVNLAATNGNSSASQQTYANKISVVPQFTRSPLNGQNSTNEKPVGTSPGLAASTTDGKSTAGVSKIVDEASTGTSSSSSPLPETADENSRTISLPHLDPTSTGGQF